MQLSIFSLIPNLIGAMGTLNPPKNVFFTSFPDAMLEEKQTVPFIVYWI